MTRIRGYRVWSCSGNFCTAPSFGLSLPYGCNLLYLHFGHSFTPSMMSWSVYIRHGSQNFDTELMVTSKNNQWTGILKRKSKERCKSYVLVFSSGFLCTDTIPPIQETLHHFLKTGDLHLQVFCLSWSEIRWRNDYFGQER